jgi:bacillithiol biosynthesis cysteine-adding enzyme BshC
MPVAAPAPFTDTRDLSPDQLPYLNALARAHLTGDPAVDPFFQHPWRQEGALARAAEAASAHGRDRSALADALEAQNAHWTPTEHEVTVAASIAKLRDVEGVAVVTGQQLGLFGGPLYTAYKALGAIQLAQKVEAETGRPCVPVFWMAGEDHDFAEVATAHLLHGDDLQSVAYRDGRPHEDDRGAVGRLTLKAGSALDDLDAAFRPTEFTADVTGALREHWKPGASWRDAFARTLRWMLGDAGKDLVLVTPDDPAIKRLLVELFQQEVSAPGATAAAIDGASEQLEAAGFHRQITPRPVNLFYLDDGARRALDYDDESGRVTVRSTDRSWTPTELTHALADDPTPFSPAVALRPVAQDTLFPTVAYVAGPGEASYWAQLRGVYERFGVPMPVVVPRPSLTLAERKVEKVLDKYGLTAMDLAGDVEVLHKRLALDASDVDIDAAFKEAAALVNQAIDAAKPAAQSADQSLGKSAEATRAGLQKELAKLKDRVVRAEKRNQDVLRGHLDKAQAGLFPGGKPQERVLGPAYVLNKYGPDLFARLLPALPDDPAQHRVVVL